MAAADYIIDLGPGAAAEGGCVVAAGSPEQIVRTPASITGRYLGSYLLRSASDVENEGGAG
jgi:excinuclease ABC subunit A